MRIYYTHGEIVWIAPGSVTFVREHVEYLLPWFYELKEGVYPSEPESGYVDYSGHRPVKARAHYEAACQVAAELDIRLAQTGLDRQLVEAVYCRQQMVNDISRIFNMSLSEVYSRINSVVSYISSGPCQRWIECTGCYRFNQCRKKKKLNRKTYSYIEWRRYKVKEEGRGGLKSIQSYV